MTMPECDRGRRNRWLGTLVAALGLLAPRAAMAQAPPPPAGPPKLARIEDFAPPEEFVMVGTVKTHFIAKGNTGPHVVLIHGFGASTYTWRGTIEALAGRYRVYALDLKGFGLTAKPKD
ncbi:MAG: alpha/beta fold hydrolase, partial [Isosphaeraceae bacterium]